MGGVVALDVRGPSMLDDARFVDRWATSLRMSAGPKATLVHPPPGTARSSRPAAAAVPRTRVLVTLLFTDVVGSTALAARMEDRPWRDLLEPGHGPVREELAHRRGHEPETAVDGFLASLDGPAVVR